MTTHNPLQQNKQESYLFPTQVHCVSFYGSSVQNQCEPELPRKSTTANRHFANRHNFGSRGDSKLRVTPIKNRSNDGFQLQCHWRWEEAPWCDNSSSFSWWVSFKRGGKPIVTLKGQETTAVFGDRMRRPILRAGGSPAARFILDRVD